MESSMRPREHARELTSSSRDANQSSDPVSIEKPASLASSRVRALPYTKNASSFKEKVGRALEQGSNPLSSVLCLFFTSLDNHVPKLTPMHSGCLKTALSQNGFSDTGEKCLRRHVCCFFSPRAALLCCGAVLCSVHNCLPHRHYAPIDQLCAKWASSSVRCSMITAVHVTFSLILPVLSCSKAPVHHFAELSVQRLVSSYFQDAIFLARSCTIFTDDWRTFEIDRFSQARTTNSSSIQRS
jgi:hypothetical protein